jgi:alcohol dehydrogenase (NADP+)
LVERFVNLSSQKSIDFEKGKMDLILNTLPVHHDINPIMTMLKTDGVLVQIGLVKQAFKMNAIPMIFGRKKISGSTIGGITNTVRLLNFCADK